MRSIANTADDAMDQVKNTAVSAKGNLMDFGTQALKFINTLRVMEMRSADTVLDRIGLQRRESALRPFMWFAAGGLAVGAVALALAPESGKNLRARVARMLDKGVAKAKDAESKVEDVISDAKKTVTTAAHTAEARVQHGVEEVRRNNIPKNDHVAR